VQPLDAADFDDMLTQIDVKMPSQGPLTGFDIVKQFLEKGRTNEECATFARKGVASVESNIAAINRATLFAWTAQYKKAWKVMQMKQLEWKRSHEMLCAVDGTSAEDCKMPDLPSLTEPALLFRRYSDAAGHCHRRERSEL